LNLNAEDYIPLCFKKLSYEEMYNFIIFPINGQHLWPNTVLGFQQVYQVAQVVTGKTEIRFPRDLCILK